MKMYSVYGSTMYGQGLAVVAANNPKEARKVTVEGTVYGFNDPQHGLEIDSVKIIRGADVKRKKAGVLSAMAYIE